MSHLIPEQRVNKNGVPVIKHVLASPKRVAPKFSVPAPTATSSPQKQNLTKSQKEVTPRRVSLYDTDGHPPLFAALVLPTKTFNFLVVASDEQIYDVLSVAGSANGLALLSSGVKDSERAQEFLCDLGMESLLEDNRELTSEALKRRIPPQIYINGLYDFDQHRESPYFMDIIEARAMPALKNLDYLTSDILMGHARLSDIKAIGAARIKKSDSLRLIRSVLTDLSRSDCLYTPAHAKKILDAFMPDTITLDNAFLFADLYGGDFAQGLKYPSTELRQLHYTLRNAEANDDRIRSLLTYADKVASLQSAPEGFGKRRISDSDMIMYHDAGVDPEVAAEGKLTAQQADAIKNHGITPSIADGWL